MSVDLSMTMTAAVPRPEPSVFSPSKSIGASMISATGTSGTDDRSEEHTSELQSLMRISYAVFCLKKKKTEYTDIATEECKLKNTIQIKQCTVTTKITIDNTNSHTQ